MKKVLGSLLVVSILSTTVPVFTVNASDLPFNEPRIQTRDFNQWQRSYSNFSFDVSSSRKTEKALAAAVISASGTAVGSLGGTGGAIVGSALGAALSSFAGDCIDENYGKFGDVGYGTIVAARHGSKVRINVNVYLDSNRTKLVYSNTYSTNNFPM